MKFSTILHLDHYHRGSIVSKVIDARDDQMKGERPLNKRKNVEYSEDKNEPLSKIFKLSGLNDLTSLKESGGAEIVKDGAAKRTVEGLNSTEADKIHNIPKLEPKKETEELQSRFENIKGYEHNENVEMPEVEDMKTDTEEPPELEVKAEDISETNESEDEFFVGDEGFDVIDELDESNHEVQQNSGQFHLNPALEKQIHDKHTKLVNLWQNHDSQAGFKLLRVRNKLWTISYCTFM